MRKVAWPTRKEVINSTIVVLIAVVVMTALIFGFDYASSKFVLFLFKDLTPDAMDDFETATDPFPRDSAIDDEVDPAAVAGDAPVDTDTQGSRPRCPRLRPDGSTNQVSEGTDELEIDIDILRVDGARR